MPWRRNGARSWEWPDNPVQVYLCQSAILNGLCPPMEKTGQDCCPGQNSDTRDLKWAWGQSEPKWRNGLEMMYGELSDTGNLLFCSIKYRFMLVSLWHSVWKRASHSRNENPDSHRNLKPQHWDPWKQQRTSWSKETSTFSWKHTDLVRKCNSGTNCYTTETALCQPGNGSQRPPSPHTRTSIQIPQRAAGSPRLTIGKRSNSDSRNIKRKNNACLTPPVPEESKTHTENTSQNTSQALLEGGRSPSGHDPRRSPSHLCRTRQPNRLKSLLPVTLKQLPRLLQRKEIRCMCPQQATAPRRPTEGTKVNTTFSSGLSVWLLLSTQTCY